MTDFINHQNTIRFSLVSCLTEDSVDSSGLKTPLDASPQPPPSNTFSVINIVNDDPLPNVRSYPDIASASTRRNTDRRTVSRQESNNNSQTINNSLVNSEDNRTPVPSTSKLSRFWPKIKQTINNDQTKLNQLFENISLSNDKSQSKKWFGKNRSKVAPK